MNKNIEVEGSELINFTEIPISIKNKSGIYFISINDNLYIGSACNIYQRLHNHKSNLLKSVHKNIIVQRSYNKYKSLYFGILKFVEKESLIKEEQFFIDNLKPKYNIRKEAKSNYGLKMSEECRLNHSIASKKWHDEVGFSEEVKNKIGTANSRYKRTEEQKENLRVKITGKKHSEKTKQIIKEKAILARKISTKYNFKGEKNPQSKLKDSQVVEIIYKLKNNEKGVILAKEYNVSTFCISLIKLNKTYKHINRDEI